VCVATGVGVGVAAAAMVYVAPTVVFRMLVLSEARTMAEEFLKVIGAEPEAMTLNFTVATRTAPVTGGCPPVTPRAIVTEPLPPLPAAAMPKALPVPSMLTNWSWA